MDNNYLQKISILLDKITQFTGMDENQKKEFADGVSIGFLGSMVNDSKDIISKETFEKMKLISLSETSSKEEKDLIWQSFFKELTETTQGQEAINKNIDKLLNVVLDPIKDTLNDEQKAEIKAIFA